LIIYVKSTHLIFQKEKFSSKFHRILKIPDDPSNTDDISRHAPTLIGNTELDMDRPEKKEIYSAWLQRSRNDNEKLI
jgi:hypothetical protein